MGKTSTDSQMALTCYAILSAIERDLRNIICSHLRLHAVDFVLSKELRENARGRYVKDHRNEGIEPKNDDALLEYLDFADLATILFRVRDYYILENKDKTHNVATKLIELTPARNRVCHSRTLEPGDYADFVNLSDEILGLFGKEDWPNLTEAKEKILFQSDYISSLVIPDYWREASNYVKNNLPIPDFDVTGFLGRSDDRKYVVTCLKGNHPIISIVGEGGVGKTALALRCLNDLIEENEHDFDAIVWVSMKTRVLTHTGISDISNAITDVLGLFESVYGELNVVDKANLSEDKLLKEITHHLNSSRILLAIDNLETVASDSLREMMKSLGVGSKILITSRVGMGEFEHRYPIEGFDDRTSVEYIRKLAKLSSCRILYAVGNEQLKSYARRLFNNALLIKWFTQGVSNGALPENLLKRSSLSFQEAIHFCFENLYTCLNDREKLIVQTIAAARRPLSQAEIFYVNKDKIDTSFENALGTLSRSSIVRRIKIADCNNGKSAHKYTLTDIALEYIRSYEPPATDFIQQITSRFRDLTHQAAFRNTSEARYKYDVHSLDVNSSEEGICASILLEALHIHFKEENHKKSLDKVRQAISLMPEYAESYRVAGFLENNLFEANHYFTQAVEYDPQSEKIRYSYAMFLMDEYEDVEGAQYHIDFAIKNGCKDIPVLAAKARCCKYLGEIDKAVEIYNSILDRIDSDSDLAFKLRVAITDQAAKTYMKSAQLNCQNKQFNLARAHSLKSMTCIYELAEKKVFDKYLMRTFAECLGMSIDITVRTKSYDMSRSILQLVRKTSEITNYLFYIPQLPDLINFIKDKPDLIELVDNENISQGANERCVAAYKKPDDNGKNLYVNDEIVRGRVKPLPANSNNFAFMRTSEGVDVFLTRINMRNQRHWKFLDEGVQVECKIHINYKGVSGTDIIIVE